MPSRTLKEAANQFAINFGEREDSRPLHKKIRTPPFAPVMCCHQKAKHSFPLFEGNCLLHGDKQLFE
jgi:hypothetical protein